jgi:hypothetical protein
MNIRSGARKYQIEVQFDIKNNRDVMGWLSEKGIPCNGELVLRKELNIEGKSRIQINEALAPTQLLKELGGLLAEVHRQGEQHSLLDKEKQLEFLDLYADTGATKREFKKIFSKYRSVKQKILDLEAKESERNSRLELFKYQLEELKKVNIKEGEEEILLEEEKILLQGEKVSTNLSYIHELLGGGEQNVLSVFPRIAFSLEKIQQIQPEYLTWKEEFLEIHSSLKTLHSRILEESEDIFFSLKSSLPFVRFAIFALAIQYLVQNDSKRIFTLLMILSPLLFIVAADGLFQFYSGANILGYPLPNLAGRLSGFFKDELIIGSYIARFSPILIGLYYYSKYLKYIRSNLDYYLIIFIFFLLLVVICSGERVSTIYFIASFCLLIFILDAKFINKIIITLTAITFLTLVITNSERIKERLIFNTLESANLVNQDTFNSKKLYLYSINLR